MSAKKLQNKIFGTSSTSSNPLKPTDTDPGLTINIPKQPGASPSVSHPHVPVPNGKAANETHPTSPLKTYKDRLVTQLQSEYDGVERHRLLQDERKERHWKRWGPYLSERQWVGRFGSARCTV